MSDRWQKIEQLFHEALDRDVTLRAAYLHEACTGDEELRREVEKLLAAEEQSTGGMASPIHQAAARMFDESPTQSLVGHRLGSYQVHAKIGEGGMGEVYRALDTRLRRDVAIKILPRPFARDPERLARFRREAQLLASLNHKNIATIYGFEETSDANFLVMELVEGETFAERIQRRGPLPLKETLRLGSQVAEGLEAAHRKGITHRDVKPANVKVTPEGEVKVLDFGLAKAYKSDRSDPDMSELPTMEPSVTKENQSTPGTPAYMSPEQVRGRDIDRRTDVWAFGCVLYEMLTGRRAFPGENIPDTLAKVLEREPEWKALPADTPTKVKQLLRNCLQKDVTHRLDSIAHARTEMEKVLRRKPRVRRPAAEGRPRKPRKKRIRALAVLPLANLSGDPEQEYFADGMTESLIFDLAKLQALRVISRTSAMRYKGTDKLLPEIAKELNVDAVVEGSVVRVGQRVRITVQLIHAATDTHLWAESYDRDLEDVLGLQGEVARAIARKIEVTVTPEEEARLASARPVNPEAHDAYLQGRFHHGRLAPGELDTAFRYYELALQKDPQYALPYAGISFVWAARQQMGLVPPEEAGPRAREAALKALELDRNLAEAHHSLAVVRVWTEWDWEAGEAEFRQAIELNPNYAETRAFYSHLLTILGRSEEAVAQMERALELDPHNSLLQSLHAVVLVHAVRYDDAIAVAREARRTAPQNFVISRALRWALYMKGKYSEAYEEGRAWFVAAGDHEVEEALVRGYEEAGFSVAMNRVAETMAARATESFVQPIEIVEKYFMGGNVDKGLEWLEKSYETRDPDMPYIGAAAKNIFAAARDNPRFQDLLRRMNLPLPSTTAAPVRKRIRRREPGRKPIRALAVLPLANLSGDPEQEYFADGMTEVLLSDLAKLRSLRIISRTSAMRYKGTDKPLPQIAKELNVDAVVEGSVLRAGQRVRITVQLIHAATDTNLWSESYERDLRDVLGLQGEVARAIARKIEVTVTPEEEARLVSTRTVNPEAYEAYLQGRFHHGRLAPGELDTALRYYERALEKDPHYAPAYAGIAFVWSARKQMGLVPPQEAGPKVREAALKALALDDTLAETHHSLAFFRVWTEWDWEGGEAAFRRAIELNPNYAEARAFYSHLLSILGRSEEALAEMERALELDPHNSLFQSLYAIVLFHAGRYDDAITVAQEARRTAPRNFVSYRALRFALYAKGAYSEAYEVERAWFAAVGDREVGEALVRGYEEGDYSEAMNRAADVLATRATMTFVQPRVIAGTYCMAGNVERGLDWLEKAYETRDPDMPYVGAQRKTIFSCALDTPRFQNLLRRMNLPQ